MTTRERIEKAKRLARRVYNCEHLGLTGYVKARQEFDRVGITEYWQNMETDDVTTSERRAEQWIRRGDYVKRFPINGRS